MQGSPSQQTATPAASSRTTLGLRYSYVNKDSDLALRSYIQNAGTLSLSYQF